MAKDLSVAKLLQSSRFTVSKNCDLVQESDMKFREDYNDDFMGVCIGPSWENYGSGEFTIKLEDKFNFRNTITGKYTQDEDDLCSSYFCNSHCN